MDAKIKNRIIEACIENKIGLTLFKINGVQYIDFYRKNHSKDYDTPLNVECRIVGNTIIEIKSFKGCEQQTFNKVFNIINQINKEV